MAFQIMLKTKTFQKETSVFNISALCIFCLVTALKLRIKMKIVPLLWNFQSLVKPKVIS